MWQALFSDIVGGPYYKDMGGRRLALAVGLVGVGMIAWGWVPAFATDMRPQEQLIAWAYIAIGVSMVVFCLSNLRRKAS